MISLLLLSEDTCFSKLEKEILEKLVLRVCLYMNRLKARRAPPLEEQNSTSFDFGFEKSIDQMKLYRKGFDLQDEKLEKALDMLDDNDEREHFYFMRDAYREGRQLLQYPENAELLFFLKKHAEKDATQ